MVTVPPPELADLARLAEGDEDPEQVLGRIVDFAVTLVPGCTAAGLTVRSPDGEETAAVSDERVRPCHDAQFHDTGSGPGREAMRYGEPRRSADLEEEDRWAGFTRVARQKGFRSCLALPLRTEPQWGTALNLYADEAGTFQGTTFDVALLFAAQGGVAVSNAERYRQTLSAVADLHRTLTTRSVIERAKGLLMSRHGVSSEEAFALLQRESQHSHRKLRDVATDLLEHHSPATSGPDVPWTPPRRPSSTGEASGPAPT